MSVTCRVLVIDDEASMRDMLRDALPRRGFDVVTAASGADALSQLAGDDVDVVITDLNMPEMNGNELCARIVELYPDLPVIVLTAFGNFKSAVDAIRAGAYDFLTKPVHLDPLALTLQRAATHRALRREVRRLRLVADSAQGFGDLVGQSAAMRTLYDRVGRIAPTDTTVLITGESGTGKELVARALHRAGRRSSGPFVAINCAAMPETLLESELFGHVRGAFTDARTSKTGLFVQASGGTLFLDEIGELPLALQPKLLRALQERTVRPLGGTQEIPFDARIVAATNRDLESAIEAGRFREDLWFRINVIQLDLPPLRARGDDILVLAHHFLRMKGERAGKEMRGLSHAAARKLLEYPWPGNVRELQNAMEHAVALARFDEIGVDDLPERIQKFAKSQVIIAADNPNEFVPLEEVEQRYIVRVFESMGRNRKRAAQILGIDRKTLRRRLVDWGVLTAEDDE